MVADACAAGKDVYCEKPMSHTVEDGFAMIDAAQKANRIIQIGSQGVSSILYAKAKEIFDSGRLGDVFMIEAYSDRNTASGAWVYPSRQTQTNKRSTGTPFWMERQTDPLIQSGSSDGVALRTMARAWLATSLFI